MLRAHLKRPLLFSGRVDLSQIKQRIDFYDTEGNFLVSLPLESKVTAAKGNTLYVLKEDSEEEMLVSNPNIIGYELKIQKAIFSNAKK